MSSRCQSNEGPDPHGHLAWSSIFLPHHGHPTYLTTAMSAYLGVPIECI